MERRILKIDDQQGGGTVNIADEVIAVIAGMAAVEVEGVAGMVGKLRGELVELLGMKNLGKGIKVRVNEQEEITLDLAVIIEFDVSVQGSKESKVDSGEYDRPDGGCRQC